MVVGIFTPDPANGFPPGVAAPTQTSWHGAIHTPGSERRFPEPHRALLAFARLFRARSERQWALDSLVSGAAERAVADSGWHDHGSTARPRPDDGGNPARRAVAPGTRASQARARLEVEGRAIVRIVVPVTLLSIRLGCYALGAIVASGGRSAGWAASANRCQCERSCGRVAVKTCWPGRSWP